MDSSYDYIVVGSGAGGGVVAARLAQRSGKKVLLVERGPASRSIWIDMPAGMPTALRTGRFSHTLMSEPNPGIGGRVLALIEGRALGGSTAVNGMGYVRGHPADYDGWAAAGCEGWSHREVLNYFRRSERHAHRQDELHGRDGPMDVRSAGPLGSIQRAFLQAGAQAGHGATTDINGLNQEGFAVLDRTVAGGRRVSTASAFIRPAMRHDGLAVLSDTDVLAVRFDGDRAIGVRAQRAGKPLELDAACEVILCGGGYASPQLLMLSGIGPAKDLESLGIKVRVDRPAVGRNLQNHIDIVVQYKNLEASSLLREMKPPRRYAAGLQWLLFGSGPAASNQGDVGAYLRSHETTDRPDLKITLSNIAMKPGTLDPYDEHAFQLHVNLLRPRSKGTVSLRSADPLAPPVIDLNVLSDPADRQALRRGILAARRLVGQEAFRPFAGEELAPGADVRSDAALDRWIDARVRALCHPCGTCRMGAPDEASTVVDARLRVVGVQGLRVADASVMPRIPAGNTAAPTIMIGERAADFILADASPINRSGGCADP